jgi:penicillin-binding protein 1A
LYRAPVSGKAVLHPQACALVTSALVKVLDRGTAAAARAGGFKKPAAGKTGTTDDYKDAWFVGFTSSLTAGVWVGFDKPQRTVAQGYGATMALPVWMELMAAAPETRYPAAAFREVSGGGLSVPVGSVPASQNPPQVIPVQSPPRVEAVAPESAPPRVVPVSRNPTP